MLHTQIAIAIAVIAVSTVLLIRFRSREIPFLHLGACIVLIGTICRIGFVLYTPLFQAPDEQAHFKYVVYLYEHHSFPIQTSRTDAPSGDWEYYQPPLYYLAALPIYAVARDLLNGDVLFQVRAIRMLSVLLWGLNVAFLMRILTNLKVRSAFLKTFALSMVSLLPTYTFISSVINNDNLAITLGGLLLVLMSREATRSNAVFMGILLGAALLTKLTAVVYVAGIGALFVFLWLKKALSLSTWAARCAIVFALGGAIFLPWGLRNFIVYGDLTAESVANVPAQWPSALFGFVVSSQYIVDSFWSVCGIHNNIRFMPVAGLYLSLLALIGLVRGVVFKRDTLKGWLRGASGAFLLAGGWAIAINLVLVLRFGILYGQGQGRFLYPTLIPIALLLGGGLRLLGIERLSRNAHLLAAAFFAAYVLAFLTFSIQ